MAPLLLKSLSSPLDGLCGEGSLRTGGPAMSSRIVTALSDLQGIINLFYKIYFLLSSQYPFSFDLNRFHFIHFLTNNSFSISENYIHIWGFGKRATYI